MGAIELLHPLQLSRVSADFRSGEFNTLWLTMDRAPAGEPQRFNRELLQELAAFYTTIQRNDFTWPASGRAQLIHYTVLRSGHADYFSLGGDLSHFRQCIAAGDEVALRQYAMSCMEMIYEWSSMAYRESLCTVALVQGRALGGGFELALAADYLIAEEHSEFGFPEIVFGLFPCTGAMSLLVRRIGVYEAERMMTDGRVYSAAELHAKGIIDVLCPKGTGALAAERFVAEHAKKRTARMALQRARHRLAPLNYDELKLVVDEWVTAALALPATDLRVMDMLIAMQQAAAGA
jgi:DSF synthase